MSDEAYGGVIGAFPYAFRVTGSRLFRWYVGVSAALGVLVVLIVTLALPGWVAQTTGQSPLVLLSNAFLILAGLAVFAPLVAPVLLVARRHRRDRSVSPGYDRSLGVAGFAYVLLGYFGLVVTVPDDQEPAAEGALAPLIELLNGISPDWLGLVFPLVAVAAIVVVHRRLG